MDFARTLGCKPTACAALFVCTVPFPLSIALATLVWARRRARLRVAGPVPGGPARGLAARDDAIVRRDAQFLRGVIHGGTRVLSVQEGGGVLMRVGKCWQGRARVGVGAGGGGGELYAFGFGLIRNHNSNDKVAPSIQLIPSLNRWNLTQPWPSCT